MSDTAEAPVDVHRVLAAPPDRVFAFFTDPALLMRWWGPAGYSCPDASVDLRVGGRYRFEMVDSAGTHSSVAGQYELIDAPRRLVFSWAWNSQPAVISRVDIRFLPHDTGTELHLQHLRLPDTGAAEAHASGWQSSFDCLAADVR